MERPGMLKIGRFNIVTTGISSKVIYRLNVIHIKIPMAFLTVLEETAKIHMGPNKQSNP